MLLRDVHDELVAAAAAPTARRRVGARSLSALAAALAALLLAAPTAEAVSPLVASGLPAIQLRVLE
jgi:hypothetical protein